jgi:hypothetical protein
MIEVTLTPEEMYMAHTAAGLRHIESILSARPDRHGAANSEDRLGIHFEGACGELAFAKARDLYWGGTVNAFKGPDLGRNIQVRTRSNHDWDLIVRSDDSDLDWFVLVTGRAPRFRIHGCIRGHDAKRPEWVKDHGGHGEAYFVPQPALRLFEEKAAA